MEKCFESISYKMFHNTIPNTNNYKVQSRRICFLSLRSVYSLPTPKYPKQTQMYDQNLKLQLFQPAPTPSPHKIFQGRIVLSSHLQLKYLNVDSIINQKSNCMSLRRAHGLQSPFPCPFNTFQKLSKSLLLDSLWC